LLGVVLIYRAFGRWKMNNREIIGIDVGEYRLLSERFEFMSEDDTREIPKYILTTRKNTIKRIFSEAVKSELTDFQGELLRERYFENMKITDISEKHGVSRQQVYKTLKAATDKLYSVLKYAYLCGFSLVDLPKSFDQIINNISEEN
jgi:DNA-directed RNA polymerase specialized sigma subunit